MGCLYAIQQAVRGVRACCMVTLRWYTTVHGLKWKNRHSL
jgi:hypothetical protein